MFKISGNQIGLHWILQASQKDYDQGPQCQWIMVILIICWLGKNAVEENSLKFKSWLQLKDLCEGHKVSPVNSRRSPVLQHQLAASGTMGFPHSRTPSASNLETFKNKIKLHYTQNKLHFRAFIINKTRLFKKSTLKFKIIKYLSIFFKDITLFKIYIPHQYFTSKVYSSYYKHKNLHVTKDGNDFRGHWWQPPNQTAQKTCSGPQSWLLIE